MRAQMRRHGSQNGSRVSSRRGTSASSHEDRERDDLAARAARDAERVRDRVPPRAHELDLAAGSWRATIASIASRSSGRAVSTA